MSYATSILGPRYAVEQIARGIQYPSAGFPEQLYTAFANPRLVRSKVQALIADEYPLYGVTGVGLAAVDGRPVIVVNLADPESLRGRLPSAMDGVPIVLKQTGTEEWAPAGAIDELGAAKERVKQYIASQNIPGVLGVGIGAGTIVVNAENPTMLRPYLPTSMDGIPVEVRQGGVVYASGGNVTDDINSFLNPILNSQGVNAISDHAVDRLAENLSRDVALQRTVGVAAGKAVATELRPWLIGTAVAFGVAATAVTVMALRGSEIERAD